MKNALFLSILLFYSGLLTLSDVLNGGFPEELSECNFSNKWKAHKCILSKFDDTTSLPDDEKLQLRIRQDFYWHPKKRIRRECRALPKEERQALFDAINTLKKDKSLSPNVYDNIADYHTNEAVDSVHFGSNFFGWHRCFILKFEELLRKVNPNVTLCYWDSRLDHNMRNSEKSIMFSGEFLGNANGPIRTGPFKGWKTIRGIPLVRDLASTGELISPRDVENILSKKHHVQITTPTSDPDTNVEQMHNMVHAYIGGQMNNFNTSSQDPFFWFHHCFIDSVWEKFCTKLRKNGIDPQDDYVIIDSEYHKPDRYMDHLFPLKNIDGYSDYFPQHIYEYEDYATCPDCLNSPYLKCNKQINRCYSIEEHEPKRIVFEPSKRIETNHLSSPMDDFLIISGHKDLDLWVFVPIKIIFRDAVHKSLRENHIPGCEYSDIDPSICKKSAVLIQSNGISYHGTYKNYIVNDAWIPQWIYAFVGVRNPKLGRSQTFVSVTDKAGEACFPYCLSEVEEKYKYCPGVLNVTNKEPRMYWDNLEEAKQNGFPFNPLQPDVLDSRITLTFLCY